MRLSAAGPALAATLASAATSSFAEISTSIASSFSTASVTGPARFVGAASSAAANASASNAGTVLVGTAALSTSSQASATATAPAPPANTLPCNGFTQLCERKLGNVTFVGAHNSPFDQANNVASNQDYGVIAQLNDGVRMLQLQVHPLNGTLHMCHTSCSLLDAGPLETYLANVTSWLSASENRLEVVALLLGNAEYIGVGNFTAPIEDSGLDQYAFVPPKVPMKLDDWPTLGQIALNGSKRALIFMDYQANQSQVDYIMDEFSQMWETPFDPTDDNFPCTVDRPPGLSDSQARDMLYMANHNLNSNITAFGMTIDIPNLSALNQTNAVSGQGSLGLAANNCRADWGRTPNFLLVDFYNSGNFPGSVFQVAAEANGLPYTKGQCCGQEQDVSAALRVKPVLASLLMPALIAAVVML